MIQIFNGILSARECGYYKFGRVRYEIHPRTLQRIRNINVELFPLFPDCNFHFFASRNNIGISILGFGYSDTAQRSYRREYIPTAAREGGAGGAAWRAEPSAAEVIRTRAQLGERREHRRAQCGQCDW